MIQAQQIKEHMEVCGSDGVHVGHGRLYEEFQ
jgi:hypothetical protein